MTKDKRRFEDASPRETLDNVLAIKAAWDGCPEEIRGSYAAELVPVLLDSLERWTMFALGLSRSKEEEEHGKPR